MNLKYKLTVLAVIALAIITILLISNRVIFSPVPENQLEETGLNTDVNVTQNKETAGAEFAPTADPYEAFIEARRDGKPIVLKFYARW